MKGRLIERGIMGTPTPLKVWLEFEAFPIWLLALDSNSVSEVCLMGFESQSEFSLRMLAEGQNCALIDAAFSNVGSDKVTFSTAVFPPQDAVYLVSGSRDYVNGWPRKSLHSTLILCEEHVRSKRMVFGGDFQWSRLRHETFGGVTQFQAALGTNIPNFVPMKTSLRRTLRHVVEYGVKPRWTPAPLPHDTNLTLDDRLHPTDLSHDIIYHTHYSATGWGKRALSLEEMGIAFGWPAWARKHVTSIHPSFPSVPVQIMDGCFKALVSSCPSANPLLTPVPLDRVSPSNRTWLPTLQRFLCHSWVDATLVTAKAAKRDDAGVPTHLWDKRCSLVLPHVTPILDTLRRLILRVAVTHLWIEFHEYLTAVYGDNFGGLHCTRIKNENELHADAFRHPESAQGGMKEVKSTETEKRTTARHSKAIPLDSLTRN
jgi:hypothetical protein